MRNNRINIGCLTYSEYVNDNKVDIFTCIVERVYNWSDTYNKIHLTIHYYSNKQERWVYLRDIKILEVTDTYLMEVTQYFKEYVDNLNDR